MVIFTLMACQSETLTPFTLTDVNTTSASYMSQISTDDFAGKTTAWYFGHAT